jgi:xanthine dehydrogenase molybdopterin-binding subunit B
LLKLERAGEGFGGREMRQGMAAAAAVAVTAEAVAVAAAAETTVTLSSWRRTKEATTGQQSHFLTYM